MRVLFTIFTFTISGFLFSQTLLPNALSATGFIHPLPQAKTDNGDFISVDGANTYSSVGNTIQVDIAGSSGMSEGIKFGLYDATGQSAIQSTVDITNDKKVYLKLKGTVGDVIRVDLKNSNSFTFVDGYNFRQTIQCTDYRWYEFDFSSSSATVDEIIEVAVALNPDATGAGTFFIDSILVGTTNISPELPLDISQYRFDADFSNNFYKFAQGDNSIGFVPGVVTATIASTSAADEGIGFTVNDGNNGTSVNMIKPLVVMEVSGSVGDTIRVNLKNGPQFNFIDGYSIMEEITTTGYQTYVFDFSAVPGMKDDIREVNLILNTNQQLSGSFDIRRLTLGDTTLDGCSLPGDQMIMSTESSVDLNRTKEQSIKLWPNPAKDFINLSERVNDAVIYDLSGRVMETYNNVLQISTQELEPGTYILMTEKGQNKFLVK